MRKILAVTSMVTIALALAPRAWAGSPTEELRRYTDRILEILRAPALSVEKRRAAIRKLAAEVLDVSETARRALGPHWQRRTAAEREEFARLFRDLLDRTYISRIDQDGGERIRYVSERVEGEAATVGAMIVTKSGLEVPVESRLLQKGGRWLVYDVLVANVSLVANYRSQFDRVIRTASYEELIKRLRTRVQRLTDGTSTSDRAAEPATR